MESPINHSNCKVIGYLLPIHVDSIKVYVKLYIFFLKRWTTYIKISEICRKNNLLTFSFESSNECMTLFLNILHF